MVTDPEQKLLQHSPARRFFGIRTKIVVPFVLLFLLCLFLVGSIAVSQVTRSVEKRLNPQRLGELVSRAGFPLNRSSLERVKEIIGCEIISVTADSEVLATTFRNKESVRAFLERNSGLRPGATGWVSGLPGDLEYYIVYHKVSGNTPGPAQPVGLILAIPGSVMSAEKMKTIRPIIVAAVVGTVLIILIGLYIAHTITRPVRRFAKFAGEVRAGNLDRRILVESRDEIRDLATAFNAMLERLRSSEAQLVEREKMAAIGSIATGMAHEIRNPLSSIRMTVQLLLRKTEDEEVKSELELVLREIERLSYTLSELLIFAHPPKPSKARTNLRELIGETLAVLRLQLEHHGVKVEQDYAPEVPEADVDPNHFRQVMMNLVINAIEAMPGGGTIRIALAIQDGGLSLRVRNSGDAIPPELTGRIFEPFFTTKAGGSGLGLAVTQIIVDSHGGEISCTSGPDGTEFKITLPGDTAAEHTTVDEAERKC